MCAKSTQPGVEVLDTESALKKYSWLKDYSWKAVDPEKDEFTNDVIAVFNKQNKG